MLKRMGLVLAVCLVAATSAHAQFGGGRGGPGGRGGGAPGQDIPPPATSSSTPVPPPIPIKPVSSIAFTGVIQAIDPEHDRVTIAYDEVEALSWPAGTMPFVVSKPALLKDATVGEKVRFKLQSQQIFEMEPY
jgi:hypothetical protein